MSAEHTDFLDLAGKGLRTVGNGLGVAGGLAVGAGKAAYHAATGHGDQAGKDIKDAAEYGGKHALDDIGEGVRSAARTIGDASGTASGKVAGSVDYIRDRMAGKSGDEAAEHFGRTSHGWAERGRTKGDDIGRSIQDGSLAKGLARDGGHAVDSARRDAIRLAGHAAGATAGTIGAGAGAAGAVITGHGKDIRAWADKGQHNGAAAAEGLAGGLLTATDAVVAGAGGLAQTGIDAATGANAGVGENLSRTARKTGDAIAQGAKQTGDAVHDASAGGSAKAAGGSALDLAFNPAVDVAATAATGGGAAAVLGTAAINGAMADPDSETAAALSAGDRRRDREAAKRSGDGTKQKPVDAADTIQTRGPASPEKKTAEGTAPSETQAAWGGTPGILTGRGAATAVPYRRTQAAGEAVAAPYRGGRAQAFQAGGEDPQETDIPAMEPIEL